MLIEILAEQLRDRLRAKETVPEDVLSTVPDHYIIDSYITCSCCGHKMLKPEQLARAVAASTDADNFLDRLDQHQHD